MIGTFTSRLLFSIITLFYFSVLYYTRGHTYFPVQELGSGISHSAAAPTSSADSEQPRHEFVDIRNSTLGFQEIFVLNLPSRGDKLDTFTLSSAVTNFTFTVLPGVEGRTVPKTALSSPKGTDPSLRSQREVGSWRAHLNFARRIVQNQLSTAILFEDDSDWDVDFKSQLELVAQGTRALSAFKKPSHTLSNKTAGQNDSPGAALHSPYGDDWDLLWLGHCGATLHRDSTHLFRIDNDPTVAPHNHRVSFKGPIDTSFYPESTRVVFRMGSGLCVYSYALSYRGAQKLLLNENNRKRFKSFDCSLDELCGSGSKKHGENKNGGWNSEFKCFSVFPQIVDSHKAAGSTARDSDINRNDGNEVRESGYTFNIVRSVRRNLEKLIEWGGWEAIRREGDKAAGSLDLQWEDQPPVRRDIQIGMEEVIELEPQKGMFD